MCGRYLLRDAPAGTVHLPWRDYWRNIDLRLDHPRYNIAPGQIARVITAADEPDAQKLPWGFKPAWSNFAPQINARAETLFTSPMFKHTAQKSRCLVLADGFYEPLGDKAAKNRPWFLFEYAAESLFAMAGIWLPSGFTIVTCAANHVVAPIHNRMPLLLAPEQWQTWLDSSTPTPALMKLLQPSDYPGLTCRAVGDRAKHPDAEGPACIAPPDSTLF